jgi:hypothetical protein
MNSNWFTHDAANAYQSDLYRTADNERLANDARKGEPRRAQPTPSVRKAAQKRTTQTLVPVQQEN